MSMTWVQHQHPWQDIMWMRFLKYSDQSNNSFNHFFSRFLIKFYRLLSLHLMEYKHKFRIEVLQLLEDCNLNQLHSGFWYHTKTELHRPASHNSSFGSVWEVNQDSRLLLCLPDTISSSLHWDRPRLDLFQIPFPLGPSSNTSSTDYPGQREI